MNTPHINIPTLYGNATKTPSGSRLGSTMSTPAINLVVQINGSKNFVASTASTKASAPSSGYPVAMMVASPQYTAYRCLAPELMRNKAKTMRRTVWSLGFMGWGGVVFEGLRFRKARNSRNSRPNLHRRSATVYIFFPEHWPINTSPN